MLIASAASASAIPFRSDPAVTGSQVAMALLGALALLVLFAAALAFAARKGWLDRWKPAPARSAAAKEWDIAVLASRRISRHTVVHLVAADGASVLVVESTARASVHPLPAKPGARADGDA